MTFTTSSWVDTRSQFWEKRVTHVVEGVPLLFVDKETLIANKIAAGRPKDLADLAALS